jgi:hypothetical protein
MRRAWVWRLGAVLLAGLLLYLGYSGWMLTRRARSIEAAWGRLQAVVERGDPWADDESWAGIAGDVRSMASDLRAMQVEGRPLLLIADVLGRVSIVGGDIAAAPALLEMGSHLAEAALAGVELATPLIHSMGQTPEAARPQLGVQVLRLLDNHPEELFVIQWRLEQAAASRQQIVQDRLSPSLQRLVSQVDAGLPLLRASARLAPLAGELLGAHETRTYLVLAQNNDELRATGGFISGVGELTVRNGRLVSLRFMDSYAVDDLTRPHPAPPPALAQYMQADYLVLRDANWSPDFPTAAQVISSLYQLDQGVAVDGVLAFDLTTLGYLLEGLGPLQIEGYDETITADNYSQALVAYWENPAAGQSLGDVGWWAHRKDFAGAVLGAALTRVLDAPDDVDWGRMAAGLRRALDEKHVLIALAHSEAAGVLRQMNWDGGLAAVDGDYLLVVDSNVGFNKVNALIDEEIEYHVWLDGAPRAELQITYCHRGTRHLDACLHEARYGDSYADMRQRCYWNYARIYLPAGARPGQISGFEPGSVEPALREWDKTVIGGLLVLAPGETRVVRLTYDLPGSVCVDGRYRLDVQKQPGTPAWPLTVVIEGAGRGSSWVEQADLRTDFWLDLPCGE